MQINYFYTMQWNKRNAMICIQLKIKCKIILLKTLENGLNKSYLMTYQSSFLFIKFSPPLPYIGKDWGPSRVFEFPFRGGLLPGVALGSTFRVSFSASCSPMLVRLMHPPSLCFSWLFWSWCLIGSPFLKASKVALVVGPNLCENVLLGYLQMYPC